MLKIHTSFTKKVPGEEQYSSLSFHTAMERELSDGLSGTDIQNEIHRSYQLLEKTVEAEIINYKQKVPVVSQPQVPTAIPAKVPVQTASLISQKQINLICSLGNQLGLNQHQLSAESSQLYQVGSYHELTKKQASAFIDILNQRKQSA